MTIVGGLRFLSNKTLSSCGLFPVPTAIPGGMKVLFLNRRLSQRGGAERWLLGLLARLQGKSQTLLLAGSEDGSLSEAERRRIGPWRIVKGLDAGRPGRRVPASLPAKLQKLLADFRPDVVHANDLLAPELLELVAGSGRGMITVQDHRYFCPGRGKLDAHNRTCTVPLGEPCRTCLGDKAYAERLLQLTRQRLQAIGKMSVVLVLSEYMARQLRLAGVTDCRIAVVAPWADLTPTKPPRPPGRRHLHVLAGRLAPHKGITVALRAARLLERGQTLVIAGDGPLAGQVAADARRPGARVIFVGWLDRVRLASLLARAVSLWLPSLWPEPFGISGLEALAASVPVAASATGGIVEWLEDGRVGHLVTPGNPVALARAANSIASSPGLAAIMGTRGRKMVEEKFAAERQVSKIYGIYLKAASKHQHR